MTKKLIISYAFLCMFLLLFTACAVGETIDGTNDTSSDTDTDTDSDSDTDSDADADADADADSDADTDTDADCPSPYECVGETKCTNQDGVFHDEYSCEEADQVCCDLSSADTETGSSGQDTDSSTADCPSPYECVGETRCTGQGTAHSEFSCDGSKVCCDIPEKDTEKDTDT